MGPYGDANTIRVSKVRAAVTSAFSAHPADEAQRETIADEGASVWVLNGSGKTGQASDIAAYLEYRGVNASAPTQRPPSAPAATKIVVYNGAENDDPATIALLQAVFGVTATTVTDPTARADIVITTSKSTPNLPPRPAAPLRGDPAPPGSRGAVQPPSSIGVSQSRYCGVRPRTASK